MNLKELKELIELVSEKGFAEFEVERQGFRLRISRFSHAPVAAVQAPAAGASQIVPAPQHVIAPPPAGASEIPQPVSDAAKAAAPVAAESGDRASHTLTSPIVGTFYRSSSPDAPPFVEVGSRVKKGQVLCIIEAMKLMNEIESDVDGVIAEIYPQNAQAVEFGEPLFGINT